MSISPEEAALAALKALYPSLSHDELILAKENLDRYLLLAWEIYEELERNGLLTAPEGSSSMKSKVDSPTKLIHHHS